MPKFVIKGLPCSVCGKPTKGEILSNDNVAPVVTHLKCLERKLNESKNEEANHGNE